MNLIPQNKNVRLAMIIGCGVAALGLITLIFAIGAFYFFKTVNDRTHQGAGAVIKATNGSCQIAFPGGWSGVPKLNEDAVISAGDLTNFEYFIVICDPIDGTARDFHQYADAVSSAMVQRLKVSSRSEATNLKIRSREAVRYNIVGTINKNDFTYSLTCIDGVKFRYQLLGWSFKSRHAVAEPIFEAISQSWIELTGG